MRVLYAPIILVHLLLTRVIWASVSDLVNLVIVRLNSRLEPEVLVQGDLSNGNFALPAKPKGIAVQSVLDELFREKVDIAQCSLKVSSATFNGHTFETIVGDTLPPPSDVVSVAWANLESILKRSGSGNAPIYCLGELDTNWRALLLDHGLPKIMNFEGHPSYFTVLDLDRSAECRCGKDVAPMILLASESAKRFTLPHISLLKQVHSCMPKMVKIGVIDIGGVLVKFYKPELGSTRQHIPQTLDYIFSWRSVGDLRGDDSVFEGTQALPQCLDFRHLVGSLLSTKQFADIMRPFEGRVVSIWDTLAKSTRKAQPKKKFEQDFQQLLGDYSEELDIAVNENGFPWRSLPDNALDSILKVIKMIDLDGLVDVFSGPLFRFEVTRLLFELLLLHSKNLSNKVIYRNVNFLISKIDKNLLRASKLQSDKQLKLYYYSFKSAFIEVCKLGDLALIDSLHRYHAEPITDAYIAAMMNGHMEVLASLRAKHGLRCQPSENRVFTALKNIWSDGLIPTTITNEGYEVLGGKPRSSMPSLNSSGRSLNLESRAFTEELVEASKSIKDPTRSGLMVAFFKKLKTAVEFTTDNWAI